MDDAQSVYSSSSGLASQDSVYFLALLNSIHVPVVIIQPDSCIQHYNQSFAALVGDRVSDLPGQPLGQFLSSPGDQAALQRYLCSIGPNQAVRSPLRLSVLGQQGDRLIEWSFQPLVAPDCPDSSSWVLTGSDVTRAYQVERLAAQQMAQAHLLQGCSQLAAAIAQGYTSLSINDILQLAVDGVRDIFQVDRVAVYHIEPEQTAGFVVEALAAERFSILEIQLHDPCFETAYIHRYQQGRWSAVDDIYAANLQPCYVELLSTMQVRAHIIVPIVYEQTLWGLLCVHQCDQPRQWREDEIQQLQQLAMQLATALQRAELHQQVQQLNVHLEQQVQDRTEQLQQALMFEEILKRVTDRVRDSLDENQILQSAVYELGAVLKVACCDTGIYDADCTRSTICYEYSPAMPSAKGQSFELARTHPIYQMLLRGQMVQFCDLKPLALRLMNVRHSILACPIVDNQGVLGDLWLFKPCHERFNELEIRLVQQVANQCAIAIRQARLHQATETQVEALASLIRLKDEFLSRISHELRTPVANMKMAIQMLGIALNHERPFFAELSKPASEQSRIVGYYRVLRDECDREISLLNDLLDLQRLDNGTHALQPNLIQLENWLPLVIAPFQERATAQQQTFITEIQPDLPSVFSSPGSLERILRELLDNACKYTPSEAQICFAVRSQPDSVEFEVTNTGIEIPDHQLPRIFDRFYWVPTRDRWQQGGTGLGLALVQKLTRRLGGTISANSSSGVTQFVLQLPLSLPEGDLEWGVADSPSQAALRNSRY